MKRLKRFLNTIAIVALVIVGIRFAENLLDWYKLLDYTPPPQIARIAATTTMTDTARRLFYVNKPTIETKKSALNLCQSSEQTVVLGCYVPSRGIFLQAVDDPRLQGVMEVTAAHEMLHAAYQRMTLLEQTQLNRQLETAFNRLQNPRIARLIATYRQQDPHVVENELHSILGTEVRDLGTELEEHYRTYFRDRAIVVALSERYEGVFTAIRAKTRQLSRQLQARKVRLEQSAAQVKREATAIAAERSSLQSARAANPLQDDRVLVGIFNDRVQSYNRSVARLKRQIETYNQLVTAYNSLALEEKSLVDSLQHKTSPQIAR